MSVTINAHQLKLLLDKTVDHMGSEYVEPLHGIRLDVDAQYLYAVASDRYTIAAARYRLNHGDQNQEPWAATIPAENLRALREWIHALQGAGLITISTAKGRVFFEGPQTGLSIAVTVGMEFPDWRGLLRKLVEQAADSNVFPALDPRKLARFNHGGLIRARLTGDEKPLLIFGEDFLGAQMPVRHAGIYPTKEETFDSAHQSWLWTLSAGSKNAGLDGAAYEEDRPQYEVTTDIRETGETLLQQTLQSGWEMRGKSKEKPEEFLAHCLAAVNGWMAFRYLDALHNVDPRAAQAVVAEVADELDSGEIGEFAWDAAEKAGFDPQKWHDDYEAHLKKLAEEREQADSAADAA
ncbi:hypothetical protein [Streptomyces lancefieldiae]|uniref:DNA polymerase III beta sliding clamp subunit n=1 Tax=Streptomyces lancefieldiae TaxID=3075520 RepID=A0ABU3AF25_9ACTN|nr:hypothetical protein [Streptomyces sp. DSM 40712]MDT0608785.1 hypothetical protein [Streptomyces sp. DSM 40712]